MTRRDTGEFNALDRDRSEKELNDLILSLPGNRDLLKVVAAEDDLRLDKIRKDVAKRLRKACTHLNEEDFNILVAKIALVQLRAEHPSR